MKKPFIPHKTHLNKIPIISLILSQTPISHRPLPNFPNKKKLKPSNTNKQPPRATNQTHKTATQSKHEKDKRPNKSGPRKQTHICGEYLPWKLVRNSTGSKPGPFHGVSDNKTVLTSGSNAMNGASRMDYDGCRGQEIREPRNSMSGIIVFRGCYSPWLCYMVLFRNNPSPDRM